MQYFTENGFPTVENEEWKYTNVAPMGRENFLIAEFSENVADELKAGELEVVTEKTSAAASYADFVFDESKQSVLVFANGIFDKKSSQLSAVQDATILSFAEAAEDEKLGEIFRAKLGSLVDFEKNGFTALNAAFIGEGVFIHLPKNAKIDAPDANFVDDATKGKFRFRAC